jgi:flagellar biogenesis protein FliO
MTWFRWVCFLAILPMSSWGGKAASVLKSIDVGGTEKAELKFVFEGSPAQNPSWQIRDNAVEVNFSGAEISETLAAQTDIQSPHALVSRVRLFPARDGSLKVRISINGSEQRLKERIQLKAGSGQALLSIDYPKANDPTLSLLKDEQQPVFAPTEAKKSEPGGMGWFRSIVLVLLLGGAGVGTYFGAKLMRKQAHRFGSRKYLIETIAYSPVGPAGKAGVGIVKVGGEFVLVGVTANHVSLLSQLPKLQSQYEDESKVERESFQEAVKEQVRELGRATHLRAGA